MTAAADQIAEINARFAERVKLLERERDIKIAMIQAQCEHEMEYWDPNGIFAGSPKGECKHCGADMSAQST